MIFLGIFLVAWFAIIAVIYGVALVFAILADVYTQGGPRALGIALVILAAFSALFFTLWLRNRGAVPDLASWFAAKPRKERWFLIAAIVGVTAITIKATWNLATDSPNVIRPCAFCSPYVQYQPPDTTGDRR